MYRGLLLVRVCALSGFSSGIEEREGEKGKKLSGKVKGNIHKTLSPASVDKSVHKVTLSPKYRAILYHQHDIA